MKKILQIFVMLLSALLVSLGFISCDSNDQPENSAYKSAYKVEYYFENTDKNGYEILESETENLSGTVGAKVLAKSKTFKHFTIDKDISTLRGNVTADGSLVLKLYYTRNSYTVNSADTALGAVSHSGAYAYGENVTVTATPTKLGYGFIGWYSDGELISSDAEYTAEIDKNIEARFDVLPEMLNFDFTSTENTCQIIGIKDKSVTEIVVPDYVTNISLGAFSGCASLESISLPFVGESQKEPSDSYQYPFGYIFGYSSYPGGESTSQKYYGESTTETSDILSYIPKSLKTVEITGGNIPCGAFNRCSNITTVVISYGAAEIGDFAFSDCRRLTGVVIPDSVASIGDSAFLGCESLVDITLPDSIKSIGKSAFRNCKSLTEITIPDGVEIISHSLFEDCTNLTRVEIPNSVTCIDANAFLDCMKLADVVIPDSVTEIGNSAFEDCSSITTLMIPNSVKTIGFHVFAHCTSLTGIELSNNITSISDYAFYYCTSLTDVVIPDSVESIGKEVFYACFNLGRVVIPDSVTHIDKEVFFSSGLTEVVIGAGVTHISESAFASCSKLTSVVIPDTVTTIGDRAFSGCGNLMSIVIGEGVESIGYSAFFTCFKLVEVINLSSLDIVAGSDTYGGVAYYAKEVHKGESKIDNVNDYIFYSADGVNYLVKYAGKETELILPDNYNGEKYEINHHAFYSSNLESVVIPDSVTSIGEWAFENCQNLKSAVIGDGVITIDTYAFSFCLSLTDVVIGNSVESIAEAAFADCYNLKNIVIPSSVNFIGGNMIARCGKTVTVYYRGSEAEWEAIDKTERWIVQTEYNLVYNYTEE